MPRDMVSSVVTMDLTSLCITARSLPTATRVCRKAIRSSSKSRRARKDPRRQTFLKLLEKLLHLALPPTSSYDACFVLRPTHAKSLSRGRFLPGLAAFAPAATCLSWSSAHGQQGHREPALRNCRLARNRWPGFLPHPFLPQCRASHREPSATYR